jgi:hypothetical protein
MGKRPRTKLREGVEHRYVSEYVAGRWPAAVTSFDVPLGPAPQDLVDQDGLEKALARFRPWRPKVDALVVKGEEAWLVEGKIVRVLYAIAMLNVYRSFVPLTPELDYLGDIRLHALVVTPKVPLGHGEVAASMGIEVRVWAPGWVREYVKNLENYWTGEARAARESRKETLKGLGFT